jgi:ABC-type branched-subunit amino acid transport system substrate-binding protein
LHVGAGFERAAKAKKLQIASTQIYKKGQADFSSEILKVKQADAEVLLAGGVLGEDGRRRLVRRRRVRPAGRLCRQ